MHCAGHIHIECFIAPQLTTIRIAGTSRASLTLLTGLGLRCPRLTDVTYLSYGRPPDLQSLAVSAGSECVRGLYDLEILYAGVLDRAALEHLSRLTSLRDLVLGGCPSDWIAFTSEPFFPSLRTLHVSSDIISATRFLGVAKQLPIVELSVESPDSLSVPDEVHQLFSAVSAGISPLMLQTFSFFNGFDPFDRDRSSDYLLQSSSLQGLFCFVNLTDLHLLSVVGIDWDDATITDMAPFDATVIPTSSSQFSLDKLESLGVDASPISKARPVAEFLAGIFPRLNDFDTLADAVDDEEWEEDVVPQTFDYHRRWKKVEAMLKCLIAERDATVS
ncbi:hypothetical protein FB45DRAFT_1150145 [Roridomyces roridus]|uniref:Uncharacterized protein n=1 Tax=Roridomyces roridus TaxID=1738132 RepID=A0AAD7BT12_9AGAR|nr:hypothetical protein FB45DRAFT_1150145 [Roridomyces roridus]